jgi:hypothetical protein
MHVRSSSVTLTALVVTALLAGANLPASSTQPEPAPPSSAPTFATPAVAPLNAPAAKAPAANPAPPATTAAPPAPDAAAAAAATAKSAHELGYSQRVRDGKTVYCRKETKVGTRFESTTCVTPEQISALVLRAQGNKESVVDIQRGALNQQGGDGPASMSQRGGPTYR